MIEQLKKNNNGEGSKCENIYPITVLKAVKDPDTDKTLDEILIETKQACNHLQVPFTMTASKTRLRVETCFRKKGLYLTYIDGNGDIITECYKGESIDNEDWCDSRNWVKETQIKDIVKILNRKLKWHVE